jgi:HlyD family secretion protein
MRWPRVRFTIGRLMVAVLVAGLAFWGLLTILPQHMDERQAEASYKQAKLIREVAEYALKEYTVGLYMQDKAIYESGIAISKSDQARALDRVKWSNAMRAKGKISVATNIADQLTKQQADFDLEQAQTQLKVLEGYTKDKQAKSLQSDIVKARADEQAKLATYRMARVRRWLNLGQ